MWKKKSLDIPNNTRTGTFFLYSIKATANVVKRNSTKPAARRFLWQEKHTIQNEITRQHFVATDFNFLTNKEKNIYIF